MPAPLPPGVQHRLAQTLGQWQQWQCEPPLPRAPELVEVLAAGRSNHALRVAAADSREFVVRIDGANPAAHGLNRNTEWRTLVDAHAAGLAPCPRYCNPDLGSLVCDYLPHDAQPRRDWAAVGRLLRAVHALPRRHHRLDLAERLLSYERLLAHRGLATGADFPPCREQALALLAAHPTATHDLVLCHNDLLAANRVCSGGRLWALDWEYAAMGSRWYDLAVVLHGDELDEAAGGTLLRAYLEREPQAAERERVHALGCVYRYLELLWYIVEQADAAFIARKRARLESHLARAAP